MSSVAELVTAVRAAMAELADADTAIAAARDRYDGGVHQLAAVVDGTDHDEVSLALAALADAAQRLDDARAAIALAVREAETYLNKIGATAPRAATRPNTHTAPLPVNRAPRPIGRLPPPPRRPYGEGVPAHIHAAARMLPGRRPDADARAAGRRPDKTHGVATNDDAGNAVIGSGVLESSTFGPNGKRPGLVRPPRFKWGTLNHVEAHVAALMRADRSLRNVTLTIDHEPCNPGQIQRDQATGEPRRAPDGTLLFKRYTCHEQVEAMIPSGARLTIFVADGPHREVRRWATYTGTGEGITDQ